MVADVELVCSSLGAGAVGLNLKCASQVFLVRATLQCVILF